MEQKQMELKKSILLNALFNVKKLSCNLMRSAALGLATSVFIISSVQAAGGYPLNVTDSFGNETTINSAKRIVALVPSVSDAIFGLGLGDLVVGRTKNAIWPEGVIEKLPDVGSYSSLNVEGVLSLNPDLVIMPDWAAKKEGNLGIFEQLKAADVDVLIVPELARAKEQGKYTMRVLEEFVELIAAALEVPEKGHELIEGMRLDAAAAAKLAADSGKHYRVMSMLPYSEGSTRTTGLMKTEDLVIRLAGAINVGAEAKISGEKEIDPEAIIPMKPDYIVIPQKLWDRNEDPVQYILAIPGVSETPAGENKKFLTWASLETHRASWRLPSAAKAFAEKLYADDK
ncbi:MAG: hypothetical protein COB24_09410 [Hyphomicrobiales bacterium]|nr:MAG: hypothetical protein COB24_09410 [Hyphomicrobiales bacterium]